MSTKNYSLETGIIRSDTTVIMNLYDNPIGDSRRKEQVCAEYESYSFYRFIFISFGCFVAVLGMTANSMLSFMFAYKKVNRDGHFAYLAVLSFMDFWICLTYILLFGVDVNAHYFGDHFLFNLWYAYILPVYLIVNVVQLIIPYIILAITFERFVLTHPNTVIKQEGVTGKAAGLIECFTSSRGRRSSICLIVIVCFVFRIPGVAEFGKTNYPNCTDILGSKEVWLTDFARDPVWFFWSFWVLQFMQFFVSFAVLALLNALIIRNMFANRRKHLEVEQGRFLNPIRTKLFNRRRNHQQQRPSVIGRLRKASIITKKHSRSSVVHQPSRKLSTSIVQSTFPKKFYHNFNQAQRSSKVNHKTSLDVNQQNTHPWMLSEGSKATNADAAAPAPSSSSYHSLIIPPLQMNNSDVKYDNLRPKQSENRSLFPGQNTDEQTVAETAKEQLFELNALPPILANATNKSPPESLIFHKLSQEQQVTADHATLCQQENGKATSNFTRLGKGANVNSKRSNGSGSACDTFLLTDFSFSAIKLASAEMQKKAYFKRDVRDAATTTIALVTSHLLCNSLQVVIKIMEYNGSSVLLNPETGRATPFYTIISDFISFLVMFSGSVRLLIYLLWNRNIRKQFKRLFCTKKGRKM